MIVPCCQRAKELRDTPLVTRFLKHAEVKYQHDLDAHAVQTFDFEFPCYNVPVWKWFLPATLDSFEMDRVSVENAATRVVDNLNLKACHLLSESKVDDALKTWASCTENLLVEHSLDAYGRAPRGKRYR